MEQPDMETMQYENSHQHERDLKARVTDNRNLYCFLPFDTENVDDSSPFRNSKRLKKIRFMPRGYQKPYKP